MDGLDIAMDDGLMDEAELLDYDVCVNSSGNETIYYYNLTEDTSELFLHFYAATLGLIIALGLVGNSLVLLLVLLDKRLRYRSIIASLSVVVCDLLLTIFYHGVALTGSILKQWSYYNHDAVVCDSYAIATMSLLLIRWCSISVIAIDRFCTVYFPFKYPRYSKKVLILLTILTWIIPSGLSLLNLPVSLFTFRPNIPTCLPSCLSEYEGSTSSRATLCRLLSGGVTILIVVIGIIIPLVVYTWLYHKGRRLRRQPKLGTNVSTQEESNVNRTMIRSRSIELFTVKDQRAAITLFLLYLAMLITTLPQIMLSFTRYSGHCIFFRIPLEVHLFSSLVFFSSTSLDPIILLRHQDFRIAIKEILCRRRRRNVPVTLVTLIRTLNEGRQPQNLSSTVTDLDTILHQNVDHQGFELQDNALQNCSSTLPANTDELCTRTNGSIIINLESRYKLSKETAV